MIYKNDNKKNINNDSKDDTNFALGANRGERPKFDDYCARRFALLVIRRP